MKKRSFGKFALPALSLLLLLTACSGNNGNGEPSVAPSASAPSAEPSKSAEPSAEPSKAAEADLAQVELKLLLPGDKPQHYDQVMKVLNEKLTDKIHATLDVQYIPWDSYKDQILVKLAAGEKFDFYYDGWWQNYAQVLSKGGALDITDLFAKYAPDLYDGLTAEYVDTNRYQGKIYGIPVPGPLEYPMAFVYRSDLAEKYGYTPDMFKTKEDVQDFAFKVVAADKTRVGRLNGEFTGNYQGLAFLGMQREYIPSNDYNSPGMLLNNEPKVVNQFETDYYKNTLLYSNKGFNGGLIDKDSLFSKSTVATDANTDAQTIGSIGNPSEGWLGDRTAAISKIEAGAAFNQVFMEQGVKMVSSFKAGNFTVLSPSSKNPERVLMLLNLIYADKDIRDTYLYGIEGQDFVAVGDDQFAYPDGLDRTKVFQNEWWMVTPWKNARIPATATETDKASIAFITDPNNFVKSVIAGFEFNPDPVKSEISKVNAVVTEYRKVLESGSGTEAQLLAKYDEFLAKMKKAGVDKIIAEKQKQIDAFLKR